MLSEKFARFIINHTHLELYCADETGTLIEVNPASCNMLGYKREELVGLKVWDIDPTLESHMWPHALEELKAVDHRYIETKHRRKDGSLYDAGVSVSLFQEEGQIYVVGFVQDIGPRKRAEEELLASRQRYSLVLNTTPDGYWMVNATGIIIDANEAYCQMSGYEKEELLGMHITDLEAIESIKETEQHIKKVIQGGGDRFESIHRRKDGTKWPVEIAVSYSAIEGGRFFSLMRDITERKVEARIQLLRQELEERVYEGNFEVLMQHALDVAEEMTESQIGFFHFVEKDQETISLQVWSTNTLKRMCFAEGKGMHYPVSSAGVWVDCIYQRAPVIHNDYASLPHKKGMPHGHPTLLREATVPVFRNNAIVAVIGLGNKLTDYHERDVALIQKIASLAFDYVEKCRVEAKMQHMAYFDTLTGLPNRILLTDRMKQAIAHARRSKQLVAVCYLDLDGFKPINDQYGHHAGDRLLGEIAKRLSGWLRGGDTVARLGGDEFALILTGIATPYECEEAVTRVLGMIGAPYEIEGHRIHVSGSIGVTLYPIDNADPDTLLRHADQAMYQAKEAGHSSFKFYSSVENEHLRMRRQRIEEFAQAPSKGELVLHYQPKVDLRDGGVIGVEALIRWHHAEEGLLFPGRFLPIIEGTPQEIRLDEWVIVTALQHLSDWHAKGMSLAVSVNVSPRHIQMPGFVDFLTKALEPYPAALAQYLELEILEISAIEDIRPLAKLKNRHWNCL